MNSKKFFEETKKSGIDVSELSRSKTTTLSFSLFHKEIDSYSISDQTRVSARGVYKGKLGSVSTENISNDAIPYLIQSIKNSAQYIEKSEEPIIFKGSERYHKKKTYNENLPLVPVENKIKKLHDLEDAAYNIDKCVTEVQVSYSEEDSESELANSYGLKLKNKGNFFYYYVSVVAKDGEEIKSDDEIFFDNDFQKFDPIATAKKAVSKTVSKFKGTPVKSKTYKAVLNQDTVSSLLNALIKNSCNAENVQKHSSLFEGKLNTQVLSTKITIEERPLEKNCFFTYFDDEGVATMNKKIINKGVLSTYLYNLETAAKDNVSSTGNGYSTGGKIGISAVNLYLKPGKMSEEQLINKVYNGVYISSITGLHAGLNPESGDFSLEAEGYHIENGKKTGPLTLITVAGNLFSIFKDVIAVANNSELLINSVNTPSIAIRNLKVSAS